MGPGGGGVAMLLESGAMELICGGLALAVAVLYRSKAEVAEGAGG